MNPTAFFVIGPAGSGKSTVSKAIARRYGAAYLDKDTLATAFTELHSPRQRIRQERTRQQRVLSGRGHALEYETLLRTCGDNLWLGHFGRARRAIRPVLRRPWVPRSSTAAI